MPPGSAIVWRRAVRFVVRRVRVVTRRRTVFVRDRRTAGFEGLRRRADELEVRREDGLRAAGLRRAAGMGMAPGELRASYPRQRFRGSRTAFPADGFLMQVS